MTEMQGADQKTRHDLVAYAQVQAAIEHTMGEADGRGLGNQVAGKQRQLHPRLALGNAIAHGRHPGGKLCTGAVSGQRLLELLGIVAQRRMGREQVVVTGNDGNVRRTALAHDQPRLLGLRRQRVGQVGAAQVLPGISLTGQLQPLKVGTAAWCRALLDGGSDLFQHGMQHGARPSAANALSVTALGRGRQPRIARSGVRPYSAQYTCTTPDSSS